LTATSSGSLLPLSVLPSSSPSKSGSCLSTTRYALLDVICLSSFRLLLLPIHAPPPPPPPPPPPSPFLHPSSPLPSPF
jgi:hypothetical protein